MTLFGGMGEWDGNDVKVGLLSWFEYSSSSSSMGMLLSLGRDLLLLSMCVSSEYVIPGGHRSPG